MVAMTGYFALPSTTFSSNLRLKSLCSVHHGPTAQASAERLLSGSSHPLPGSLNFSLALQFLPPGFGPQAFSFDIFVAYLLKRSPVLPASPPGVGRYSCSYPRAWSLVSAGSDLRGCKCWKRDTFSAFGDLDIESSCKGKGDILNQVGADSCFRMEKWGGLVLV